MCDDRKRYEGENSQAEREQAFKTIGDRLSPQTVQERGWPEGIGAGIVGANTAGPTAGPSDRTGQWSPTDRLDPRPAHARASARNAVREKQIAMKRQQAYQTIDELGRISELSQRHNIDELTELVSLLQKHNL